jgi:hypothetical protein
MTEIINPPVVNEATTSQRIEYVAYFLLGTLEVLLFARLIFRLLGASMASGFVVFIYNITTIFIAPFRGIFSRGYAQGVETTAVLEPETIVAIVVYMIAAWGIVKLIRISSGEKQE